MSNKLLSLTATIASGASLSDALDLTGLTVVGLQMPSTWTAAAITLESSADNATFDDVYDSEGNELSLTADASRFIPLAPTAMVSYPYLKLRSGTSGTPVNQAATRVITVIARAIN